MHGSSSVPQEWLAIINEFGGAASYANQSVVASIDVHVIAANDIKVDLILKYMNRLDKDGWEYALDHIIECEMSFPGKDPNGFFRARVESEGKAATVQAWMIHMNLRTFIGPGVIPHPNDFESYGRIVRKDMEEARWNHFKDWVKWSENVISYAGFDERGAVHEVMEGLRTQSVMRWIRAG